MQFRMKYKVGEAEIALMTRIEIEKTCGKLLRFASISCLRRKCVRHT